MAQFKDRRSAGAARIRRLMRAAGGLLGGMGLTLLTLAPIVMVGALAAAQWRPEWIRMVEAEIGRIWLGPTEFAAYFIAVVALALAVFHLRGINRRAAAQILSDLHVRWGERDLLSARETIYGELDVFDAGLDYVQTDPVSDRERRRFAHKHFLDYRARLSGVARAKQAAVLRVLDFFDEMAVLSERGAIDRGAALALFGQDLRRVDRIARPFVIAGVAGEQAHGAAPPGDHRHVAFLRLADAAWGFKADDPSLAQRLSEQQRAQA